MFVCCLFEQGSLGPQAGVLPFELSLLERHTLHQLGLRVGIIVQELMVPIKMAINEICRMA